MAHRLDIFERLSRWASWLAFGLGALAFFSAPLLAIGWSQQPFPGFLMDPTLVVNGIRGDGWPGAAAGPTYPQRLVRMGGRPVSSAVDIRSVLAEQAAGEAISIFAQLPDGSAELYPQIQLTEFATTDLLRLFWLPYLVGLAYLVIGYWLYRVSGHTRPGRAIAFFCACTAISTGLIFDLSTTHLAPALWSLALALAGGALISLALRFPVEWHSVTRRPWLLSLPYGVSLALGLWGWIEVRDLRAPWDYVAAWGSIYRYVALGIILFLGLTAYQAGASKSPLVRRQARIVLAGSLLAFTPVTAWFLAPAFDLQLPFNASILLPSLLFFPVAVGLAILRYRLWQVDTLVNRAVVYGVLTAVLAGVFTALIGLSQRMFVVLTGERSDAAIILTTLIVVSAATPIRSWLQVFVDRRFREAPAASSQLGVFSQQVQTFVEMNDPQRLARRLLTEAAEALGASSAALKLAVDGQPEIVHMVGPWRGEAISSIPLYAGSQRFGLLQLGPRADRSAYTAGEVEAVQQAARQVAEALRLSITPAAGPAR